MDLSKLPPDLAEQVRKALSKKKGKQDGSGKMGKGPNKDQYTKKGKGPNKEQYAKKGPPSKQGNEASRRLPPGLANKSADHPGRMAFLKAMNQNKTEKLKQQPKKDKQGDQ